jgi:hypothetical protein
MIFYKKAGTLLIKETLFYNKPVVLTKPGQESFLGFRKTA